MEEGNNRSYDTMTITDNAYIWDFRATTTSEPGLTDVGCDDDFLQAEVDAKEGLTDVGCDENFMIEFHRRLKECVERCGGVYVERIGRVGEMMISAFADQNIHSYTLDYGCCYEAISITLLLDDDLKFFVRCEKGDEEDDIIEFSIRRGDYVIRSTFDQLSLFRQHVNKFFFIRQQRYIYASVSKGDSTARELPYPIAL